MQRALRGGGRRPGSAPGSAARTRSPPRGPALVSGVGPRYGGAETPAGAQLQSGGAGSWRLTCPPPAGARCGRATAAIGDGAPGGSDGGSSGAAGAAPYLGDSDSPTSRFLIGSAQRPPRAPANPKNAYCRRAPRGLTTGPSRHLAHGHVSGRSSLRGAKPIRSRLTAGGESAANQSPPWAGREARGRRWPEARGRVSGAVVAPRRGRAAGCHRERPVAGGWVRAAGSGGGGAAAGGGCGCGCRCWWGGSAPPPRAPPAGFSSSFVQKVKILGSLSADHVMQTYC